MRVLIVDDSPTIRKRLQELLAPIDGLSVIAEAGDAARALEIARQERPDVTIVDLSLPEGTGIEVLQGIKAVDPRSVVMVLTNYALDENRRACLDAGADYFFDKSNDFDRVPGLLSLLVNMRRLKA